MTENSITCISKVDNNCFSDLEPAEEVTDESVTPFSTEISVPYQCSTSSFDANLSVTPFDRGNYSENSELYASQQFTSNTIKVPIVGYEVMEERARFTVYKLRVEHTLNGNSWVVYRRYTDFVRLCTVLKTIHPDIAALLPRKRWFGNNFDPDFLNDRVKGLQQFVNAILAVDSLLQNSHVQDFLCLNESPLDTERFLEDSRAICDALSETIYHLKNQLREKDMKILELNQRLCEREIDIQICSEFFKNCSAKCQSCSADFHKNPHLNKLISNVSNGMKSDSNENICDRNSATS